MFEPACSGIALVPFRRFIVAVLTLSTGVVARAEPPHMEFVDKLRANGHADLALEYLSRLQNSGPKELATLLPLERAKCLIQMAERQEDEKKRDQILIDAQKTFQQFLDAKPNPDAAADASLELARVIVLQGRHRLTAARRAEDKAQRKDGLAQARADFDQAAKALASAERAINGRISALGNPESETIQVAKARWEQRKLEAQFEAAVMGVSKALTLGENDTATIRTRSAEIDAARRRFQRLSETDVNNPLSWQAYAWLGRCWMELENIGEAKKTFDAIERESARPAAADAARVARYFQLQLIDKDPNAKSRAGEIIRGCDEWLNRYQSFVRSPEGQGVQFLLATTLIAQAQSGFSPGREKGDPPSVTPTARQQLVRAERLLKELSRTDSEYTRKASNLRSELLVILMAERAAAGIDRLINFEECHLTAQVEAFRWSKAETETARLKHLQKSVHALERGLKLVSQNDVPKEVFDARVMLSYLYLLAGDPYSSAVLGEHLARSSAPAPRGAKAAVYALSAHATILAQSRARQAPAEELQADERRIRELARFMEQHWAHEPETDAARFQLGELFFNERDYVSAIDMFARVKESFPAFAYAKMREGAAAQLAQAKEVSLAKDKKKQLLTLALNDLEKVADPAPGFSTETILSHFQAKLQLATLLLIETQRDENYRRVEQIGASLLKALPNLVTKDDPLYPQLECEAERIRIAGITGQAYLQVKSEKYDEARQTLRPLLNYIGKSTEKWKKSPHVESPWYQAFLQAQREVLLLNLKADVLEGKLDEAKRGLESLRMLSPDGSSDVLFNSLLRVVYELKIELDQFKTAKETNRQKKLEEGMINLLDQLGQAPSLSTEARIVLGQAYGAVDRHDKAAELLVAVKNPPMEDEAAQRAYRFVRLHLAKEYRLAKKFNEAKAILREILGTQQQKGWGFDNLDVRKESIELLQDEGNFAAAVQMAVQMQNRFLESARQFEALQSELKQVQSKPGQSPEAADKLDQQIQQLAPQRERFFEFYYLEIQSIIKHAQKSDPAKAADTFARLANRIVKLEQNQKDLGGDASRQRLAELIDSEPRLKEKYITAGGKTLIPTPTP